MVEPSPVTAARRATLFLALWAAVAQPANAADPEPAAQEDRARELFDNGRRLFRDGAYEDAIAAWEEAWRLSAQPDLLYNLVNAYERAGRLEEALDRLSRYRAFARKDEVETVEARVRSLQERVDRLLAERAATEAELTRDREAAEARLATERAIAEADARARAAELAAERDRVAALEAAQARQRSSGRRVLLPLGGAGVAAVGGLTGAVFTARAGHDSRGLDALCRPTDAGTLCTPEAARLLRRKRLDTALAWTGYGLGAAGLATGAVLFAVLDPGPRIPVVSLAPGGRPGLGVTVAW